jgi:hypothetical protein
LPSVFIGFFAIIFESLFDRWAKPDGVAHSGSRRTRCDGKAQAAQLWRQIRTVCELPSQPMLQAFFQHAHCVVIHGA